MFSQKKGSLNPILSILLSTTPLLLSYAVAYLAITTSYVIISFQSLLASGAPIEGSQINISLYLLFVSSLILTQIPTIALFALIVYVQFLQSPDHFTLSAVKMSCKANEEGLKQAEDVNKEGPDQLSASTAISLQQNHSEGDSTRCRQTPGQIPATGPNPSVGTHAFSDSDESAPTWAFYKEPKFSLLPPDVKAAMSSADFDQISKIITDLVDMYDPTEVYTQCFGYAIFRNNMPILRFLLNSAFKEGGNFDQYCGPNLNLFILAALERGYYSVIGCLNEYVPSQTRKSIENFGKGAVSRNSVTSLKLVWRYLHDDGSFIRQSSVRAARDDKPEILQFLEQSSHFGQQEINEALWAAVKYRLS